MAEKTKKAKAPTKLRSAAAATKQTVAPTKIVAKQKTEAPIKIVAKQQTVAEKLNPTPITHEQIAQLARNYWAERGHQDGQAEQDWLRAEQKLLKIAS